MRFIHFLFLWLDQGLDQNFFVGIFFMIIKQTIILPYTKNLPISFAPGFSMGALFFEGMNYGINSACRPRPKSLNHDVGGTFFYLDRSRVCALIKGFCNAITS